MAVWTGLEPATPCVTGRYSNQLNYHTILGAISCLNVSSFPRLRCKDNGFFKRAKLSRKISREKISGKRGMRTIREEGIVCEPSTYNLKMSDLTAY